MTPVTDGDLEWRKCKRSIKYFFDKYVYLIDRNSGKVIKWIGQPYLYDILDILGSYNEIAWAKSRQVGASWLLCGFGDHTVLFNESANSIYMSKGEDEAFELLDKSRFIISNLPDHLRYSFKKDNRAVLEFNANLGKIKALASTVDAGRSTDATFLLRDELAFHPYGKANFLAVGPTIDGGGKSCDVSTIDKLDANNHFTQRMEDLISVGVRSDPYYGFTLFTNEKRKSAFIFVGASLRQNREEGVSFDEWYERLKEKYEDWELEQEYPLTLEQLRAAPKAYCRFDTDALVAMLGECVEPIETRGFVKIYKRPVAGRQYCFVVDSSEGHADPCCGIIQDWQTSEDVAEFHGKISVDEQAMIAYNLYCEYNEPFTAVERNADGRRLIDKMMELGVKKWYYSDIKHEKPGWWTQSQNRSVMLGELAEGVFKRLIRIPNKEALAEFQTFIRTDKHPDGVAQRGRHDDYVMAHAIMTQVRKKMPMPAGKVKSYSYLGRPDYLENIYENN